MSALIFLILFLTVYTLVASAMVGWFVWWCHQPLKQRRSR